DPEAMEQTETYPCPALGAPPVRDTLTILAGTDAQRVFILRPSTSWIGRDPECHIRLRDSGVSRRHACLAYVGRTLLLRDNGAKNGTYINGRRIREHALVPGDEIQLGPHVALLFSRAREAAERRAQHEAAREEVVNREMYLGRLESL